MVLTLAEILINLQDKATSGKGGLGIKDRPIKVAGCRFQGKKVSLNDSDDEDSAEAEISETDSPGRHENGEKPETDDEEPKVKLKKLCRQLLRSVCFCFLWKQLL